MPYFFTNGTAYQVEKKIWQIMLHKGWGFQLESRVREKIVHAMKHQLKPTLVFDDFPHDSLLLDFPCTITDLALDWKPFYFCLSSQLYINGLSIMLVLGKGCQ